MAITWLFTIISISRQTILVVGLAQSMTEKNVRTNASKLKDVKLSRWLNMEPIEDAGSSQAKSF